MRKMWTAVAASIGVHVLIAASFAGGGIDTVGSAPSTVDVPTQPVAAAASDVCVTGKSTSAIGLDTEQASIARRAVAAAGRAGVGDAGAVILIAAGIVESGLRNLTYGDRDSIGWLQQRPSQGWRNAGDVDKAADDFLTDMTTRVKGWRSMPPGDAAQAVQRSGYPARYGRQVQRARSIVATIKGDTSACPAAAPTAAAGKAGAALAWGAMQVGKPYVFGSNGPNSWDCSSFSRAAMAQAGVGGMPRTAQGQRDWCAAGNCTRIPEGSEQPGDLAFWDSYRGPNLVGHVVIIRDPKTRGTVDARSTKQGVINGTYPRAADKTILEFWRPKALSQ